MYRNELFVCWKKFCFELNCTDDENFYLTKKLRSGIHSVRRTIVSRRCYKGKKSRSCTALSPFTEHVRFMRAINSQPNLREFDDVFNELLPYSPGRTFMTRVEDINFPPIFKQYKNFSPTGSSTKFKGGTEQKYTPLTNSLTYSKKLPRLSSSAQVTKRKVTDDLIALRDNDYPVVLCDNELLSVNFRFVLEDSVELDHIMVVEKLSRIRKNHFKK